MSREHRNDLILILALVAASVASIFLLAAFSTPGATAEITVAGAHFASLPLDKDAKIDVNGLLTVVVEAGAAHVEAPACPNKICQNHAPISNSGEAIICAPGKVMVKISGRNDGEGVDFVQ